MKVGKMTTLKTASGIIQCAAIQNGVPVNPKTYSFPMDGHRRSEEEINLWRRQPYILGEDNEWKLFCLLQSGYRPQLLGTFETLDDALNETRNNHREIVFSKSLGDLDF